VTTTFWGNSPTFAFVGGTPTEPGVRVLVPTGPVPEGWASVVASDVLRVTGNRFGGGDITATCALYDSSLAQVTGGGGGTSLRTLIDHEVLSSGETVTADVFGLFEIEHGYVNVQCETSEVEIVVNVGEILVTPVNQGVIGYQ
jgi:hypothetical protein